MLGGYKKSDYSDANAISLLGYKQHGTHAPQKTVMLSDFMHAKSLRTSAEIPLAEYNQVLNCFLDDAIQKGNDQTLLDIFSKMKNYEPLDADDKEKLLNIPNTIIRRYYIAEDKSCRTFIIDYPDMINFYDCLHKMLKPETDSEIKHAVQLR